MTIKLTKEHLGYLRAAQGIARSLEALNRAQIEDDYGHGKKCLGGIYVSYDENGDEDKGVYTRLAVDLDILRIALVEQKRRIDEELRLLGVELA